MSGRLLLRFAKMSGFAAVGTAVAANTMSWPWSLLLGSVVSGLIAVLQQWFKIFSTENKLK